MGKDDVEGVSRPQSLQASFGETGASHLHALSDHIRANQVSKMDGIRLSHVLWMVRQMAAGIEGDFCEVGVYKGGNGIVAASAFKLAGLSRRVWLFDSFNSFARSPDELDGP